LVLIDDASGRLVAEALGLNSKGTVYVILSAARAGAITKGEAKNLITELISAGFWISSEIVGKILNELG
jgi:predicted nucleic acid-binding protein